MPHSLTDLCPELDPQEEQRVIASEDVPTFACRKNDQNSDRFIFATQPHTEWHGHPLVLSGARTARIPARIDADREDMYVGLSFYSSSCAAPCAWFSAQTS